MPHTPEKWHVGYAEEYDIDAGDDGRTIGYPTGRDEFDGTVFMVDGEDQIEIIAEHIRDEKTAHLIAAAPDLLTATEAWVAAMDKWLETGIPSTPDESKAIYDAAVAAVKKARCGE
mgnify:FL=1